MEALKIRGYNLVSSTCQNPKSGGLAIYAIDGIGVRQLEPNNIKNTEACGIQIIGNHQNTYKEKVDIWNVYSRHKEEEAKATCKLINKTHGTRENEENKVIVVGDLNCDMRPSALTVTKTLRKLIDEKSQEDEIAILNDCTQATYKSDTVIDLAISMGNIYQAFAVPVQADLNSDHFPLVVGIRTGEKSNKRPPEQYKKFKRDEKTSIKLKQQCIHLKRKMNRLSVNQLAKSIINIWNSAVKKPAKTTKKKKKRNRWWNSEIQELYLKKQRHLTNHGRNEIPRFCHDW